MKQSAGLLPYRINKGTVQFFLVHPGGPFWKNKDEGAWSIAKGEFTDEDGLDAAKREFVEETGYTAAGKFIPLSPVKQKNGKVIHAWAVAMDIDADKITSNTFGMEWPPGSGITKQFPETDKAGWFNTEEAKEKLNAAQSAFIDELVIILDEQHTR